MKCLVVLSHLMSKDCKLSIESKNRSKLAIKKFYQNRYKFLITLGWAYRKDCSESISDVIKNFIIKNSTIDPTSIISISSSRDTVGDAYFTLDYVRNFKITEIHVVTSDYHKKRVKIIFNKIFNKTLKVKIFNVQTNFKYNKTILTKEAQSINAFYKTFLKTNYSDKNSIFETLLNKHPYYNGKIFQKIESN